MASQGSVSAMFSCSVTVCLAFPAAFPVAFSGLMWNITTALPLPPIALQIAFVFVSSLFVVPSAAMFSISHSLKGGKCSKVLTARPDCISPRCFSFVKKNPTKTRGNNVTLCYTIQRRRNKEPHGEKAQTRQKRGQEETET